MKSYDRHPGEAAYIRGVFAHEDSALQNVMPEAREKGLPDIAVDAEVGRFLQVLVTSIGARRVLELGTLAGYSGIWIARGLVKGGTLVTIEADPTHAAIARTNFERAGVADRVEIRVARALDVLPDLPNDPPFDVIWLDAVKSEYPDYLEEALRLVRPGGLILADNALLRGRVVEEPAPDDAPEVVAMRAFHERLASAPGLVSTLVPVRDGVTVTVATDPEAARAS